MRSATGIPAVFRPMSRFATILARVDVSGARVGRAISSLMLVFTFCPFSYLSCEGQLASCHNLHSFHFQMTRLDLLQIFERSNTTATGLPEELCCWQRYPTAG